MPALMRTVATVADATDTGLVVALVPVAACLAANPLLLADADPGDSDADPGADAGADADADPESKPVGS